MNYSSPLWALVVVGLLLVTVGSMPAAGHPIESDQPRVQGDHDAVSDVAANESTSDSDPNIYLEFNGDIVSNGDYRLVKSDPSLAIDASVDSSVNASLENLIVRIDGRTERSYNASGREASVELTLPLDRGNNTVTIIAEDSNDNLKSVEFTVGKDDIAPWVGLVDPYSSDLRAEIPDGTVNSSVVEIGVRVGEFSSVSRAEVTVQNNGTGDGFILNDPGHRFSGEVLLSNDNSNEVYILVSDELGNTRLQTFSLTVDDGAAPRLSLDLYPSKTTDQYIDLSGTLRDNVWVREASLTATPVGEDNETGFSKSYQLRSPTNYSYSRTGRSVEFRETIGLSYGTNELDISVSDQNGETTTRTIKIERIRSDSDTGNEPPTVSVDENRTHLRGDGTLQLDAVISDPDLDLTAVSVETANASTGEVTDFDRFSNIDGARSVPLNTTLDVDSGEVRLRIRAFDDRDNRDVETLWLSPGEENADASTTETTTTGTVEPGNETAAESANETTTETTTETTASAATTLTGNVSGNTTGNATGNESDGGGLPLIGSLPFIGGGGGGSLPFSGLLAGLPIGAVVGLLSTAAPFIVGGLVFVTIAYFVLRRVQGGGGESAS